MHCYKQLFCLIICSFLLKSSVADNIHANFSAVKRIGCNPFNVQFYDSSSTDIGNITNWLWNFGDGQISNEQNPSHYYTTPGSYNVSLKITGTTGDTSLLVKIGYIKSTEVPSASFLPKPSLTTLDKPVIEFANHTQNETANTYFNWNFGDKEQFNPDGGISTLKNPSYNYSDTGLYTVMLIAKNEFGCCDTTFRQVIVFLPEPKLITFLNYPFTPFKIGDPYYSLSYYPIDVDIYVRNFSFEVFDLTGKRLFYSDKWCNGWKGNYMANGKFTPNGFYIARLKYLRPDNTWHDETQKIFLINSAK